MSRIDDSQWPEAPRSLRQDAVGRGRNVRVRVVESFARQRVGQQTGPLRRIRSAAALLLAASLIGVVLAAGLSAIVWGISIAVQHATNN